MGDLTVEVIGGPQLLASLEEIAVGLPAIAKVGVAEAGLIMAAKARSLAPRGKTGNLQRSIRPEEVEIPGTVAATRVTYNVPYGRFQETGTRNMPPHAFLEPAFEQAGTAALAVVARDLARALDAAWR